jgi:hypothetical protein
MFSNVNSSSSGVSLTRKTDWRSACGFISDPAKEKNAKQRAQQPVFEGAAYLRITASKCMSMMNMMQNMHGMMGGQETKSK